MPAFGGLTPFPLRFGGGVPLLQRIVESLNATHGDALDVDQTSIPYALNMSIARAIWAAWSGNLRMRNQFDPQRMTDMLGRWLTILQIPILPTDTDTRRRQLVAATFLRWARPPTQQAIADAASNILGPLFVSVQRITTATPPNAFVPASPSWGAGYWQVDSSGAITWYSTISNFIVIVAKPASMTEGDFYQTIGQVRPVLDSYKPAWTTFSLVREGSVPGHFILDDPHNLDNERFA